MIEAPDVTNYLDYRKYLSDFFEYKKKQFSTSRVPYSYAHFSASCGLKSPQYLKLIIEGSRNLSEKTIPQFARALSLKKEEAMDFRLLVLSNQETEPGKRALLFKELMDYRVQMKIKKGEIAKKHFEQIPNWATWVLFEAVDLGLKFEDSRDLQRLLRNKVSTQDVTRAINQLSELGLIEKTETGYKKKRHLIENAEDIPIELIRSLQSQFMYLALESLYQDSPKEREFGSATLALTKKEFEEIRFKLRQLRKAIQKDISVARQSGSKGDRIYQLNIQLYPVTEAL
jgi:uncharacterized protein (TIGR02147 family)